MPAQSNALGHEFRKVKALKVRPHFSGALLQSFVLSHPFTQGVALGWYRSHRWCSEFLQSSVQALKPVTPGDFLASLPPSP